MDKIFYAKRRFAMPTDTLSHKSLAQLLQYVLENKLDMGPEFRPAEIVDDENGKKHLRREIRKVEAAKVVADAAAKVKTDTAEVKADAKVEAAEVKADAKVEAAEVKADAKVEAAEVKADAKVDPKTADKPRIKIFGKRSIKPAAEPTAADMVVVDPVAADKPTVADLVVVPAEPKTAPASNLKGTLVTGKKPAPKTEDKPVTPADEPKKPDVVVVEPKKGNGWRDNLPLLVILGIIALCVIAALLLVYVAPKVIAAIPTGSVFQPAPAATEAPASTQAPASTEAPASTQAPAVTEAPASTKAPANTQAPATTEAPASTEAPTSGGITNSNTISWPTFYGKLTSKELGTLKKAVSYLDYNNPAKQEFKNPNWTVTCSHAVVWMTAEASQKGLAALMTDGLTGIFLADEGTKVQGPGSMACLDGFDGKFQVIVPDKTSEEIPVSATACEDPAKVDSIMKAFGTMPEVVISMLDTVVNNNPDARLAAWQPGVITGLEADKALLWTSGTATNAVEVMRSSTGKIVYLATGGDVHVSHDFSGVRLCSALYLKGISAPAVPQTAEQPVVTPTVQPQTSAGQGGGVCAWKDQVVKVFVDLKVPHAGSPDLYPALEPFGNGWQQPGKIEVIHLQTLVVTKDSIVDPKNIMWQLDTVLLADGTYRSVYLATANGTITSDAEYFIISLPCKFNPDQDMDWSNTK
jgi:hypothetical protein